MACSLRWVTAALVILCISTAYVHVAMATDEPGASGWIVGAPGASCSDVCGKSTCNRAAIEGLNYQASQNYPYFASFMTTLGFSCTVFGACTEPSCAGAYPMVQPFPVGYTCLTSFQRSSNCNAAYDGYQRVCCCGTCAFDVFMAPPTATPTATPTTTPSPIPTASPTATPTAAPTGTPTPTPTSGPTPGPTPCAGGGWKAGDVGQSCAEVCAETPCACNSDPVNQLLDLSDEGFGQFLVNEFSLVVQGFVNSPLYGAPMFSFSITAPDIAKRHTGTQTTCSYSVNYPLHHLICCCGSCQVSND